MDMDMDMERRQQEFCAGEPSEPKDRSQAESDPRAFGQEGETPGCVPPCPPCFADMKCNCREGASCAGDRPPFSHNPRGTLGALRGRAPLIVPLYC